MNKRLFAHIALFSANTIYGINYFVVKEVVPSSINPVALTVIRAVGALFFLWTTSLWFKTQKIDTSDHWKMIIGGLLGVTISQSLLIIGLSHTSSINASIIMTTSPLFVLLVSAMYLKTEITLLKIAGIILGASGAILVITSNGSFSISNKTFLGDCIILANALSYGFYLVWTKPLMAKYDSFTVMRWMFLYGALFMCIFGGHYLADVQFKSISFNHWLAIFFIIFGATFLTYLLNIYGLKSVQPTTVSIYIYLQPILASLMAVTAKNDSFTWTKITSMILVFIGVYLVSIYKGSQQKYWNKNILHL